MIRAGIGTVALLPLALFAQSTSSPAFEVASVKPAAPVQGRGGQTSISGDLISLINTTVSNVIGRAYQVRFYQIDAPQWVLTERYDIIAKAPDNTPKDQIPLMLQALLADRFKLKIHRETRELPAYELTRTKNNTKLRKAEGDAIGSWEIVDSRREARRMSMGQLVTYVSLMLRSPILDKTGMDGAYNFPLDFSMEEMGGVNASSDVPPRPSVFTSLQEIGLKLEPRRKPFEVIVVDGGTKTPTEN